MKLFIENKCHKFGNNIDTDQICPGRYLELTDPKEIASHCLEGANENFSQIFTQGEIIVAGTNFGCGSSREHAAISLKAIGVGAVIAESFARIFYRNAINMGVTVIVAKGISECVNDGDSISIDLEKGLIKNNTNDKEISCEPISAYALKILEAGGIKPLLLAQD